MSLTIIGASSQRPIQTSVANTWTALQTFNAGIACTTLSTSGIATIVGSVPGTPSAGQVLIGGGAIKAGGSITGASLTSGASVYVSNTNGISLSDNAVGGSIGYGYNSGRTNPASHIWYNGISTQIMSLSAAGALATLAGISCATLTANDAGGGPQLTAQGSVQGSVNILKTGAYGFQIYSNAVNSLQFYDNQAAYAPFSIYGGTPGTPGATSVFVGNGQIKAGAGISCTTVTASGATGAFRQGTQPTGGEDVSAWINKSSSVSVARGFQSYITHSGAGGSTAYDAVASTSATAGHNVCYQGVSKATGAATPSYLSFAYGSGDSASSATIANAYGYYWGGWTGAGTITNKWAFFNAATDKSFFGGDVYYNSKFAVGVSTSTALSWSLTINNPTTPLIAMQRAEADFAYITNAATVLSGKPTTDLAIVHASTGAVWLGGDGVGMLKVDGSGVTVAGKITTVSAVPGSFADLAAVRTWLAANFT